MGLSHFVAGVRHGKMTPFGYDAWSVSSVAGQYGYKSTGGRNWARVCMGLRHICLPSLAVRSIIFRIIRMG